MNNSCKAWTGHSGEFGILGIGTTRAVSPDCCVFVQVTVMAVPQDVNKKS